MRIDSSGNLVVGTTSAPTTLISATSGGGIALDPDSFSAWNREATSSNHSHLVLNQTGVDAQYLQFRKDGTQVGSIGVDGGDNLYLTGQSGNTGGIYMNDAAVSPAYQGVERDNYYNLGKAPARWKDLYLSGGVYLGGTGSANYLDDYEEGTFNLSVGGTATYTLNIGRYVKIGGLVHVVFDFAINTLGTGSQSVISGLPFPAFNTTAGSIGYYSGLFVTPVYPTFYITNISTIQFAWNTSGAAQIQNNGNAFLTTSSRVIGSCTYWTS
jgi:hypothetical protein